MLHFVIDASGAIKETFLKTSDVWNLEDKKVIIPFDDLEVPTSNSACIYGQVLGHLVCEPIHFPITYKDWRNIPLSWKHQVYNEQIKVIS